MKNRWMWKEYYRYLVALDRGVTTLTHQCAIDIKVSRKKIGIALSLDGFESGVLFFLDDTPQYIF